MSEVKHNKGSKVFFIVLIFLILMAAVTIGLLYFTNEGFKSRVDSILIRFSLKDDKSEDISSTYSQVELNNKKEDLAEYFLSEGDDATYKLYVIKSKDEVLYSDIIKLMNKESTSITSKLVQSVKELQDMDDVLIGIHEEFAEREQREILEEVNELENTELILAVDEIKLKIENDDEFVKNLNSIITNMSIKRASDILYYIDEDLREEILNVLEGNLRAEIEKEILNRDNQYINLVDKAKIYENKSSEFLLSEIGNTDIYNFEELAVIYLNLSRLKTVEVLTKVDDTAFIDNLFSAIRVEEKLRGLESITGEISKGIEFFKEYENKIYELVKIYEDMEPSKVADIFKNMIENNSVVTQLDLESESAYEITNSMIIKDVFKNMDKETISNILNNMETEDAATISQMLAIP